MFPFPSLSRSRPAGSRMKSSLRIEPLEDRLLLSASLVKDLVVGPSSSAPRVLHTMNDAFYFSILNRLYRSDGTAGGTDHFAAFGASRVESITHVNSTLYFNTRHALNQESALYKSDGTADGTVQVAFWPGLGQGIFFLTPVGNRLFFVQSGFRLYVTDGTPGTPPVVFSSPSPISNLTNVNGTLFFTAQTAAGRELWKSDGTPQGTVQVKDIHPNGSSDPSSLVNVNGLLWFSADDGTHGRELWASDGTADNTFMVSDIRPGPEGSDPQHIIAGEVYHPLFSADDGVHGRELWMCCWDGMTPSMIADILPGPDSSSPENLTDVSGYLFFTAFTYEHGRELWFSDWLPEGTVMLKDIREGPEGSNPAQLTSLYGYWVYFSADDGQSGRELYVSDWTTDGTGRDTDIFGGASSSNPDFLVEMNGAIYFAATDAPHGRELWGAAPWRGPGGGRAPGDGGMTEAAALLAPAKPRPSANPSAAVQINAKYVAPPVADIASVLHDHASRDQRDGLFAAESPAVVDFAALLELTW